MVSPPSMGMVTPVRYEASGDASIAMTEATSSGLPSRLRGIRRTRSATASVDRLPTEKLVWIVPGATAFTMIPCGARSTAMVRVIELDARLGDAVHRLVAVGNAPGNRRVVDDATGDAQLDHRPSHLLGDDEHPGQVDPEQLVPHLVAYLKERCVANDSGVVYQDGHFAKAAHDGLDRGSHLGAIRHITRQPERICPARREPVRHRLYVLGGTRQDCDCRPLSGQTLGDRLPDPLRASSYYRHFAHQAPAHVHPLLFGLLHLCFTSTD